MFTPLLGFPGMRDETRWRMALVILLLAVNARASSATVRVISGASFQPGLAPGAIATIFGYNLTGEPGPATSACPSAPFRASRYFISSSQINFVVPKTLIPGPAALTVQAGGELLPAPPISCFRISPPAFFTTANGRVWASTANGRDADSLDVYAPGPTLSSM